MIDSHAFIVIPVKSFHGAKRRLDPVLGVSERAGLARVMLDDVLAAAVAAVSSAQVMVVSGDAEVADHVRSVGVRVIDDEGAKGTNAAVKVGFDAIGRNGGGPVAALLGDIPGLASADVASLFDAAFRSCIALAPASHDRGTNALALDRIGRIASHFGPDSFSRHVDAANAAGFRPTVIWNRRLGLDLDEPAQLFAFLDMATSTRTDSYLRRLGLGAPQEAREDHVGARSVLSARRSSVEMRGW
jgi:2-phospho-L-lactate guanylyltransferase